MDGCNNQSIKNQIHSEVPFSYIDNINAPSKPDVNCVTPNVNFIVVVGNSANCNQYNPIPVPNPSPMPNPVPMPNPYTSPSGIEVVGLEGAMGYDKQKLLLHYAGLYSEQGNLDKVVAMLEKLNTPEAFKLLTALHYSLGNSTKANYCMAQLKLPTKLDKDALSPALNIEYPSAMLAKDKQDFIALYDILLKAQVGRRTIMNLTDKEYTALENLTSNDTRAALMANSILTFTHKKANVLMPEVPMAKGNKANKNSALASLVPTIQAYPNPFEQSIVMSLGNIATDANNLVVVTDLVGNTLGEYAFAKSMTEKIIDAKDWMRGFYVATLYSNGAKTATIKMIKQ
jgi:hypothetical protein